ncbi:hypothetical protein B566_EDAN017070 [Ephemera danica]|nr:hypothetical protein B566_EDAN017070 [Ephemera danica]
MLVTDVASIYIAGSMGEEEPCKSPSLLSSLRQFRYTSQQPRKMSHHGTSESSKPASQSDSPLKLNTQIFKRLHDESGAETSPPPVKREKFAYYNGGEKVQEALKFLKKIYPLMDIMDIQDALVQSDYNVDMAVKALNKVIISKIDIKPQAKPVATVSTMTSTAVATEKTWKRIGPPQFKFAKVGSTSSTPAVSHTYTPTAAKQTSTVSHTYTPTAAKQTSTSAAKQTPVTTPKPASVPNTTESNTCLDYYNPRAKKQSVLDFLSSASMAELVTVPGVTYKKAEIIMEARPFSEWNSFCKKVGQNGIAAVDSLRENIAEVLRVRNEVSSLMKTCSELSQRLDIRVREITMRGENYDLLLQPSSLSPGLKLAGYQMVGLTWLRLLFVHGVNGILADEMGLGKTIQVIAFLAYLKEQGLQDGVHLIVVPSSTLENWMNELEHWCPSLKVQCYYGSQEERREIRYWWRDEKHKAEVAKVDILLTTYNLVNSTKDDKGFFRKLDIQYIVYDEAHMLKNMATQRYQALMRIQGRHRILLTGTPLQNNLIELMSLLIFVTPNIFAEKTKDLKTLFKTTKAVSDGQCSFEKEKIMQAKRIMEPFVLRRLKKDVLSYLPPKTEVIEFCEMSIKQAGYYRDMLREFQDADANEIEDIEDPIGPMKEPSENADDDEVASKEEPDRKENL